MLDYKSLKPWHYILFAIFIKALFFLFFQSLKNPDCFQQGTFFTISGDAKDYVQPVENLIIYGEHRTDQGHYDLRMPGYTPALLFFRLFTDLKWAINLTLFLQVILSGISCYALARIALKIFNSQKIFLFTYLVYLFSTYVSIWDTAILTESFATSAIIFSLYFLILGNEKQRRSYYFLSGLFLIWCVFLRPFMIPVILLFSIILVAFTFKKSSIKSHVVPLLFFLTPIVVVEGSWILRNFLNSNELLFTQSRKTFNDSGEELSKRLEIKWFIGAFVSSFGGDHTYWNPKGVSYWFFNEKTNSNETLFPAQLFNDSLTMTDLVEVKRQCLEITADTLYSARTKALDDSAKTKLRQFYYAYKQAHPTHFYFTSRLIHLKKFILHSGVYNIPFPAVSEQTLFQKLFKSFYALLYLCVFIIGGLGSLYLLGSSTDNPLKLTIILIPFYLVLLFPIIFKIHEFRFNTIAYPFFLISFIVVTIKLFEFVRPKLKGLQRKS